MAIHVTIQGATIQNNQIALDVATTNDARPGETYQVPMSFVTNMSAAQIKASIDATVNLLWQAVTANSWSI